MAKSSARKRASPVEAAAALPAPASISAPIKASFTDSTSGKEQRFAWAQYSSPMWNLPNAGVASYSTGGWPSREQGAASQAAQDMITANPVVASLVEQLTTNNVGDGLTLSSKIDAQALGVTDEQARDLRHQIETAWKRWAECPLECDAHGRHTIHEMAAAGFEHFLQQGEVLAFRQFGRVPGASSLNRIRLGHPFMVDASVMRLHYPQRGYHTFRGVVFHTGSGRVVGYMIRPFQIGAWPQNAIAQFVPAATRFGTQNVIHLFQLRTAGQVRGITPLVGALTPSMEQQLLAEVTLKAAALQAMVAITVESDAPRDVALSNLQADDGMPGVPMPGGMIDGLELRGQWYGSHPVKMEPGMVNHLAIGDKLHMHRSETPNSTYGEFNKGLSRLAAAAAGQDYATMSSDFSDTSFAASRLATEMPHRINTRRRASITEKFYRSIFSVWLEEAVETGVVTAPAGCRPFWQAREAWTQSKWLGHGRIVADPLKAAEATELELKLGLTTLTDACAERGADLDTIIAERAAENAALKAAGLPLPTYDSKIAAEPEQDEPAPSKRKQDQ